MSKVGIYRQHLGGAHRAYLERYEQILMHNNISCIWLDANSRTFWQQVSGLDLFIYHWEHYDTPRQIAQTILPLIESEMAVPCFPNRHSWWHYDDKIKQYYLLNLHAFPVIESYIFWEKDKALEWLQSAPMPVVFKLKGGAGSSNVILVHDRGSARRLIKRQFGGGIKSGGVFHTNSLKLKGANPLRLLARSLRDSWKKSRGLYDPLFWQRDKNYVYFQRFLPGNSFDTRVSVIGERAFGFRRFNRENDFRASGSGRIDYDSGQVDPRCLKLAFAISKSLKFQSMAYDFLMNEKGEVEIGEISYTFMDTAIYNCPGYWDEELNWHQGHFWPQYFQLMDCLGMKELKQPDL